MTQVPGDLETSQGIRRVIRVPLTGDSYESVIVARWLKTMGEPVEAGEPAVELKTDKFTFVVNAPTKGVIEKIIAPSGKRAIAGEIIGIVGNKTENINSIKNKRIQSVKINYEKYFGKNQNKANMETKQKNSSIFVWAFCALIVFVLSLNVYEFIKYFEENEFHISSRCEAREICRQYAEERQRCASAGSYDRCMSIRLGDGRFWSARSLCANNGDVLGGEPPSRLACLMVSTQDQIGSVRDQLFQLFPRNQAPSR